MCIIHYGNGNECHKLETDVTCVSGLILKRNLGYCCIITQLDPLRCQDACLNFWSLIELLWETIKDSKPAAQKFFLTSKSTNAALRDYAMRFNLLSGQNWLPLLPPPFSPIPSPRGGYAAYLPSEQNSTLITKIPFVVISNRAYGCGWSPKSEKNFINCVC